MFNKKKLFKFFIYLVASFFIFITISAINIYFPEHIRKFDNSIRDYMFLVRGVKKDSGNVIIIDLDEKSINELGQWPWSRNKVGRILQNLTDAGIGVIGMDIVFAEKDQSSPSKVLKEFNITAKNIPDYDKYFDEVVASTPTILGYQFELEDKKFIKKEDIDVPVIVIEKNRPKGEDYLINAKGTILNHPDLQDSGYSSGFFNNLPDDSGIVRSVPMVIRYDDQLYPSLALEIIRVSMGINKIIVNYNEYGAQSVQIGDFVIPTNRHAQFIVNFRGPGKSFKYFSALDIYNNNFDPKDIEGKVALIGTTAAGLNDLRATPFESVYPGVEVHANIIDNILTKNFLSMPQWIHGANIVILLVISILAVFLVTYTPFWFNPVVLIGMTLVLLYLDYYALFHMGLVFDIFLPIITVITSVLVATFMDYIREVRNEKIIKNKFASKVSRDVMEKLLEDHDNKQFQAMQREVTVFFSDLRGFTNISEAMPDAKTLIDFMNDYMNPMTEVIMKHYGTIDKYIGDAIMAYWNAPSEVKDHAKYAVNASLTQLHLLRKLNSDLAKNKKYQDVIDMAASKNIDIVDIGIGLNTGIAIVGEMGSSSRSDYTVIGDAVNLGSRLESLCKYYGSRLNISNFTKEQLPDEYIFRFLDLVTVKGKTQPIEIWQIHDYKENNNTPTLYKCSKEQITKELELYHKGIELYKDANFKDALDIFVEINSWEDKTNIKIYDIYIQRCEHYIENPPSNFNGVYQHTTKG